MNNKWKAPTEEPPEDIYVLVKIGTKACGDMFYEIAKKSKRWSTLRGTYSINWYDRGMNYVETDGFIVTGWMRLPSFGGKE